MNRIRLENLPNLLNDMKNKSYVIDSFPFTYNTISTIVIIKTYYKTERKPHKYAYAKLEFINSKNITDSITAYCDFFEVHFNNAEMFYRFFNISHGIGSRAVFIAFAECFAKAIPNQKVIDKVDPIERRLLGGRSEGNNPNAVYLFEVRRNGLKENGERKKRTIENSNKTETLRKYIYDKYKDDDHLSFCYSDSPERELEDDEIIKRFASNS
jgi:hypothetical protein